MKPKNLRCPRRADSRATTPRELTMPKITSEYAFEEHIEAVLLKAHGYFPAQQEDYDKALCLRPETIISFIRATQTKKWADYCELIGDKGQATRNLLKRIKEVVDKEGTLHALRKGFDIHGRRGISTCATSSRPTRWRRRVGGCIRKTCCTSSGSSSSLKRTRSRSTWAFSSTACHLHYRAKEPDLGPECRPRAEAIQGHARPQGAAVPLQALPRPLCRG
jgi:hypothetical protein